MFGILLSAFNAVLGFVLRSIIGKFFLFFGLYFVTTEFIPVLVGLLPGTELLTSSFQGMPSGVAYLLQIFALPQGISMVLAAYATRFMIRRIPVIG